MKDSGNFSLTFDIRHTGAGYVDTGNKGVSVKGVTLDSYLEEKQIKKVDLLKIDIEGNETSALQGAERALRSKKIAAIYFEYCTAHLKRSGNVLDPISFLQDIGWEVFYCREFDRPETGSHALGDGNNCLRLRKICQAADIRITDLLALPSGVAQVLDPSV